MFQLDRKRKLINTMKATRYFLLKGIESFIDHIKSVNTLGVCYWKKASNKRLSVGDICYLYLSDKSHNAIRYKLEVVDTSCERIDSACWKKPFKADSNCYKLKPIGSIYLGHELDKEKLEDIGISRYVQFMELSPSQVEYIDKYF